jgi:hypothetical protein
MDLPGVDGSFGGIAAVNVGGHWFESHVILLEGLFELTGAFVVDDVQAGCVAI